MSLKLLHEIDGAWVCDLCGAMETPGIIEPPDVYCRHCAAGIVNYWTGDQINIISNAMFWRNDEIRRLRDERATLRADNKALLEQLKAIYQQVTNGRVCYFGDHTGYQPQFSEEQAKRWAAAISQAERP